MFDIDNIFKIRDKNLSMPLHNWYDFDKVNFPIEIRMIVDELSWYYKNPCDNSAFFFQYEKLVNRNNFLKVDMKNEIQKFFFQIFRKKWLATKYYKLWKQKSQDKYYEDINDVDLYLQELPEKTIYIYEGFKRFKFSPKETIQIILNNIHYNSFQTPYIKTTKNEYTQCILNKVQLYNIFIALQLIGRCPWLIKQYALVDFNNEIMLHRHYNYLKRIAIKNDIVNLGDDDFRKDSINLINRYITSVYLSYHDNIKVDINISKITTPILRVYLTQALINNYELMHNKTHYQSKIQKQIDCENRNILFKFWARFPEIIKSNDRNNAQKSNFTFFPLNPSRRNVSIEIDPYNENEFDY